MREPTVAEEMEAMLDALLACIENEPDDCSHAPPAAARALSEVMAERGNPVGSLTWATISQTLLDEGTTVGEFRGKIRRTIEKLALEGPP